MNIAIVGATSAIATAFARLRASRGDAFCLVARDQQKVDEVAKDLVARGASSARTLVRDFSLPFSTTQLLAEIEATSWATDIILVAHGVLPNQDACERNPDLLSSVIVTNFSSVSAISLAMAQAMAPRGSGTVIVIGSVAGDRPRPSNYIYGSTKAALDAFCVGLRERVRDRQVRVILVKPGMVRSPMTEHLQDGVLFASPEKIASAIERAIGSAADTVYAPWYWRLIMLIVRLLPSQFVRRM